ncbi:26S proteasome regulatory subunit [Babesia caballi]|uniref:26S proteasome regulatory subunit n=1 Tax=Babesia caballi TaxID=5871 RepID=A0AAV4LZQ4_BABCB|nr:26S proteasome regulatory subunit [Babesia caballi]
MILAPAAEISVASAGPAALAPQDARLLGRVSSVDPVLALLHERDDASRELGLRQIDALVDTFWAEIADSVAVIERLHEDTGFPARDLAALVASKVYFHLQEYPKALHYALAAGDRFDPQERSEYANIIVAKAIGEYIQLRQAEHDAAAPPAAPVVERGSHARLEALVTKLIETSVSTGDENHAVGVALDSRRLDLILRILGESPDCGALLDYILGLMDGVLNREFSTSLYEHFCNILLAMPLDTLCRHYSSLVTCLYRLNDHERMAQLLLDMVNRDDYLRAYQICYDLVDVGDQKFLTALKESPVLDVEGNLVVDRVKRVLSGKSTTELYLQFLHRKNHTDLRLLEQYMNGVNQRSSVAHNAVVISHAIMQAGTCCDVFLRDNLSWLAKANNWAKFTATASVGVIHRGYVKNYKKILSSYLPGDTPNAAHAYSEGGSLYAIGLILSNHYDPDAADLLLKHLRNDTADEAVHHGAALGLGLVCMGRCDSVVYEDLKATLFKNSAVSGQAAAIAIGLLMFGSGNPQVLDTLYSFCVDTQHEKIVRACALAIGMILYRCETDANQMITSLCKHNEAVVRYGGMYAYAMAFCGTGSSKAVKDLLYASVSDVSDDVRRAAVISIGFVLCNTPEEVPRVLKLLVASYNPHVRYGAAMAIGISCASNSQPDVVKLLHSLASDRSDFVRQGAFIALGLVLQQSNAESCTDIMQVRDLFKSVATEKNHDIMAKFGAIMGAGLMDAGGQNCVASLYTCRGNMRREAVAGFLMFTQYWYWHSFTHFIGLTLQPTCLVGINGDLQIPTGYKVLCTSPPKLFDYVPHVTDEPKESKKEETTAVLSISAKRRAWLSSAKSGEQAADREGAADKSAAPDDSASVFSEGKSQRMEISSVAATLGQSSHDSNEGSSVDLSGDVLMASDVASTASSGDLLSAAVLNEIEEAKVDQLLAGATLLQNPCRLLPRQAAYCVEPRGSRYAAVFPDRRYGIVLLRDQTPDAPEEYVACDSDEAEARPFTPFEYKC